MPPKPSTGYRRHRTSWPPGPGSACCAPTPPPRSRPGSSSSAAAMPSTDDARTGWHAHPGSGTPAGPDALYAGTPPWDIGRPQPAFASLAGAGALTGRVLDAGCGTGEHTLMAAGLGLDATGIDLAATALRTAERKARQRGLTARFLRWDALRLAELGQAFGTVLDCGLFHLFDGHDRAAYTRGLRTVLV